MSLSRTSSLVQTKELAPTVVFFPLVSPFDISVEELEDRVFLRCNESITWLEGTVGQLAVGNKTMDLGKRSLDPRGLYVCNKADGQTSKTPTLQVYYRSMCFQDPLRWNGWGLWI